jgi:hypothetical protein
MVNFLQDCENGIMLNGRYAFMRNARMHSWTHARAHTHTQIHSVRQGTLYKHRIRKAYLSFLTIKYIFYTTKFVEYIHF